MGKLNRIVTYTLGLVIILMIKPLWAQANRPLMAGVAGPAINLTYAFVAQDVGLWKKYGLDARVIVFEAGSTLAQVARSGDVKFAINLGRPRLPRAPRGRIRSSSPLPSTHCLTAWSPQKELPNGATLKAEKSRSAVSDRERIPRFGSCARNSA